MARTVYLHIGTHKTGTSSIQATLSGYADAGIRYAALGAPNHSLALYTLFAQNPERHHLHVYRKRSPEDVIAYRESVAAQLEQELAHDSDLILSGEELCEFSVAEVEDVAAYLAPRCEQVRVIAYYRDPLGFSGSSLQQRVKAGLGEFRLIQPEYRRRIEPYIRVFGRDACDLRRFDRHAFPDGSVVSDFAEYLGIDSDRLNPVTSNTSVSRTAVSCLLFMNRSLGIPRESALFFDLRRSFVDWLVAQLPGEKFLLPEELFAPVMDAEDIRWMEDVTGTTLISPASDSEALAARRQAFVQALETPDKDQLALLRDLATHRGLTLGPREPVWRILNRLFLDFVEQRSLGSQHADILRDIAVKIIQGQPLGSEDARALLRLARTLRPEGPRIAALIASLAD